MRMKQDTAIKVAIGAVLSLILSSIFDRGLTHVRIDLINSYLEKCPNSEYKIINLGSTIGSFHHARTNLYCSDNSIIEIKHKLVKGDK